MNFNNEREEDKEKNAIKENTSNPDLR